MARNQESSNSTGTKLKMAERRKQVLAMTVVGASSRQMAQQFGVSHPTILNDAKIILKELADQCREDADKLRARETERYQRMVMAYWYKAIGIRDGESWRIHPDPKAAQVVFTAIKGLREIWNLDIKEPTPGATAENPFYIAEVQEQELGTDKLSDKELFALDDHVRGEIEEILQRNGESPSGPGAA